MPKSKLKKINKTGKGTNFFAKTGLWKGWKHSKLLYNTYNTIQGEDFHPSCCFSRKLYKFRLAVTKQQKSLSHNVSYAILHIVILFQDDFSIVLWDLVTIIRWWLLVFSMIATEVFTERYKFRDTYSLLVPVYLDSFSYCYSLYWVQNFAF